MRRVAYILLSAVCVLTFSACTEQESVATESSPNPMETTVTIGESAIIEEESVFVPVTELFVSSQEELPDMDTLIHMKSLRLLDLTALPYTSFADIELLSKELPSCQILWNQELTDGVFRSDSAELTLPNATIEDINLLNAFSHLRKVDAIGSKEYRALYEFQSAHPEIEVHYALQLGDRTYSEQTESITVPKGIDPEQFLTDLRAFPNVKEIDLISSGWTAVWIESLKELFPETRVRYLVQIGGLSMDSSTDLLDLRSAANVPVDQLIAKLSEFSNLETVALPSGLTEEDTQRVKQAFPTVTIIGAIQAYGTTIEGGTEELDLSKSRIQSTDEVEALLKQLPFLKKLILCDCGLSDEQMITLCEAHPDIRFVWIIEIGKRKLRTDAVGFSTKNPSKYTNPNSSDQYNESVKTAIRLKEGDIELLKYCTDLEALDLGHNYLTNRDLEVISGLTKLKILILADNKITDISALTTLKELEYIELFMNNITDLSPLCEMPALQDVNVCKTGVTDLTPLFSLTGVKRLWYALNPVSREQAKQLKETLTDCLCNYTASTSTGDGWREDPRYQWMRAYFQGN